MKDFQCVNPGCQSPHVQHAARGLCRTCYSRVQKDGALALWTPVFQPANTHDLRARRTPEEIADEKYERWIRNGNKTKRGFDAKAPARWLNILRDQMGLVGAAWGDGANEKLAERTGLDTAQVIRLLNGSANTVDEITLERVALASGRQTEYAELIPPQGKPGWSEGTDWCEGCGTFHHPHHADGLCEECYTHRGDPDFEARDVRVTRKVRNEEAHYGTATAC